jgi:hypothetical protein
MPSVITFAPIAAQVARLISLDELLPRDVVEDVLREHRKEALASPEAKLPDDVEPIFGHYFAVTRAAVQLLGAPAFERLARLHDEIEEQYMPGGPPMSPVYDSFAMQFVLGSIPQGIGNETPYSVLARLLAGDAPRARIQRLAQSMAEARFELYRVKRASGHGADLEPARGGGALSVRLTGPFLRTGDFGLMRVLQFDDKPFIADSPYLLKASEGDWREHLARVVARRQSSANAPPPRKASKLGKKDQARRREKEKARASRNDPEEIVARYLKFGLSERYWFDYVMDAYAGERGGIVFLAGVPDRPELLPHSAEYAGEPDSELPPMAELRDTLMRIATKEGLLERARRELGRLRQASAVEAELSPNEQHLLTAYAMFGLGSENGTTALDRLERSHRAEALRPEVRTALDSIKNGWFSVLRVERIRLEEGIDVFDVLRAEKLRISERSATRQLGPGDLMLGWVCKDQAGTLTLEGGLAHVPSLAAEWLLSLVEEFRRRMPPITDDQAWKRCAAEMPLPLLAGILELRANPPLPEMLNTSGDPVELVTGHYRIRDRDRVLAILSRDFVENGDGSYAWVDDAGTLLARVEPSASVLRIHVNSRKRLQAVQQRLEDLLGKAIERSLEAHEDLGQAVRTRQGSARKPGSKPQRPELSPELAAELQKVVLAKIRSTLDEPIPQFRSKTLRQLARSTEGRHDAISWLRQQERILKSNPQLAGLDMRPLWQELALPYQGLETDPPL